MEIKDLNVDIFKLFNESWALVTAGDLSSHNSMTISWGSLGTIWNKPIATIYIKPCRYTHDYIEKNDYFVVSFFDEKYKYSLSIMGTKSGRDINKDNEAKLTPYEYKGVTLYKEAKVSLLCKKIYQNDLDIASIPTEAINRHYQTEAPHTMYIGEVTEIINK